MAKNTALHKAAVAKKDEFYTQLPDIEKEMKHYREFFRGKTVFCNCDDPYESNFFKYFANNFNTLGLKKLITTCYVTSPVVGQEFGYFVDKAGQLSFCEEGNAPLQSDKKPYKVEITEVNDVNGDGRIDMTDVECLMKNGKNTMSILEGDGDFRSDECVALLKEADVVVTNPPFSLFREYVAQLVEYDKKFIIIGNQNAITYKEIFPLIKENKLWLGNGFSGGNAYFAVPDNNREFAKGVYDEKTGLVKFRNCCWFTNVDIEKRHEDLILYKTYNSDDYPHYDNYDAIEVSKTAEIPLDYDGVMGVPITFLDKYNPEQFEIVGSFNNSRIEDKVAECYVLSKNTPTIINGEEKLWNGPVINKKPLYKRIVIRRKRKEK